MANTEFIEYGYCATDYYNENNKCTIETFDGKKIGLSERCLKYTKVDDCSDFSKIGVTYNDYNFLMGITSNMLGFTLVFLVGFLFILQGRR